VDIPLLLTVGFLAIALLAALWLIFGFPRSKDQIAREQDQANARILALQHAYDQIWLIVQKSFLYREGLVEWDNYRYIAQEHWNAPYPEALLQHLVARLQDKYSFFETSARHAWRKKLDAQQDVVEIQQLAANIGYIRLRTFASIHCASEMEAAMRKFQGASGLILDLRGNRGGLIDQCLLVFSLFVDEAVLCHTASYKGTELYTSEVRVTAAGCVGGQLMFSGRRLENLLGSRQLVILVDEKTASASEMLLGGLKGRPNVTLVGRRTFGKGVLQETHSFAPNIGLQLTVGQFYAPNGLCCHGQGIYPDKMVDDDSGRQFNAALALLRAGLKSGQNAAEVAQPL